MHNQTVKSTISDLIQDDGYTSFGRLPDSEKNILLGLHIKEMGKYGYEVLVEGNHSMEIVDDLIGYLVNDTQDAATRLVETMRKNALAYLHKSLSTSFDDCYSDIKYDHRIEAGLHPIVDQLNGELRWVR